MALYLSMFGGKYCAATYMYCLLAHACTDLFWGHEILHVHLPGQFCWVRNRPRSRSEGRTHSLFVHMCPFLTGKDININRICRREQSMGYKSV